LLSVEGYEVVVLSHVVPAQQVLLLTDFLAAFLTGSVYSTVIPSRPATLLATVFRALVLGNRVAPSFRANLVAWSPGIWTVPVNPVCPLTVVSLTVTLNVVMTISPFHEFRILTQG